MNDYRENMFYVPIVHIQCRDWNKKQKKLMKLFDQVEIEFKDGSWTNYYNNCKQLNKDIQTLFDEELESFLDHIDIGTKKIHSSWFEASVKGGYHKPHTHGATGYSAVCYVKYDPEEHTPVTFVSPFFDFCTANTLEYVHTVDEGSILFFPSAITHYTLSNTSDKERIVLSFNIRTEDP
jgi:hypothetical protein